jgi:hypothetical protein
MTLSKTFLQSNPIFVPQILRLSHCIYHFHMCIRILELFLTLDIHYCT